MSTLVRGLHHITTCPAGAQEDVDFFTRVLGQRLVKQTVLMDGRIPVYHFYYGNADADMGSIATSFPYSRKAGKAGTGQVSATAYAIPAGAASFWKEHFDRHHAVHSGVQERFGRRYIRVRHPAGTLFEMVEDGGDTRRAWTTPEIGADVAATGFFGAVLSVRDLEVQEQFFVEALGFRTIGSDGPYRRLIVGEGRARQVIDLLHEPAREAGTWGFGSGTAHHIAFEVDSDAALVEQKTLYEELGYTDASEIKDRFYFHSMYVRSPGGILVECTANVPGGFCRDEPVERLGTQLHLPPWYEEQRAAILSNLEPVAVPEQNRPPAGEPWVAPPFAPPPEDAAPAVPLSRTRPAFRAGAPDR
jgi:glyoxalase family protein